MTVLRPCKTAQTGEYTSSHKGYDFSGKGDDLFIYASFDCQVKQIINSIDSHWVANQPGDPYLIPGKQRALRTEDYGNFIKVQGESSVALSAHIQKDSFRVSVGQWVKRGDILAVIGHTGNSTGRHCHTEYRLLNGVNTPVDFVTNYPTLPGGTMADAQALLDGLIKRYNKQDYDDFNRFLIEHLGEDGHGGHLQGDREFILRTNEAIAVLLGLPWDPSISKEQYVSKFTELIKRLVDQANQVPAPPSTPLPGLPVFTGYEIDSIVIKPKK